MNLEPPLANLVARCQTICVAECCGIHAYDFSPIHIASYLLMYRGCPDDSEIGVLLGQIEELKAKYGVAAPNRSSVIFDDLNQVFTPEEIARWTDKLLTNIEVALVLIEKSEALQYKSVDLH